MGRGVVVRKCLRAGERHAGRVDVECDLHDGLPGRMVLDKGTQVTEIRTVCEKYGLYKVL